MDCMFETEHLVVRKFHMEDTPNIYQIHLEDAIKRWIPNESYADLDEAREAIEFSLDCVNAGKLPYVLAVTLKEAGELIGDSGVNNVEGKENEVEIGYVISEKHSGKGYSTELLAAMTDYVVSTFCMKVLYGRVMRGNDASVRILEKNGYVFLEEECGAEDDLYGNGMLVYKTVR